MPDRSAGNPVDVLRAVSTPMPEWLVGDAKFTQEIAEKFFASRVVYYPGAGSDGHVKE